MNQQNEVTTQAQQNDSLSEIQRLILDGSLLRMTQVSADKTAKCYITLRTWGEKQWATHYYNAALDSFEFGHYHRNLSTATAEFENRVAEYQKLEAQSRFSTELRLDF
jgi:hypothetical protein